MPPSALAVNGAVPKTPVRTRLEPQRSQGRFSPFWLSEKLYWRALRIFCKLGRRCSDSRAYELAGLGRW